MTRRTLSRLPWILFLSALALSCAMGPEPETVNTDPNDCETERCGL